MDVFAASSLTDVVPRLVARYRALDPDAEFELVFAGSQTLATQIEEGAPADLFISANRDQAERLLAAGLIEQPVVLAQNRLVLAVRDEAPWRTVEDVASASARIAAGAPGVPVGALTERALALLDEQVADALRAAIVTRDPNARVVLSRVELGEADAAFVYHTDLAAARGVRAIALPDSVPANQYVVALVSAAGSRERASAFIEFLTGDEARALLSEAGFLPAGALPAP